jgi:hypothetical protein
VRGERALGLLLRRGVAPLGHPAADAAVGVDHRDDLDEPIDAVRRRELERRRLAAQRGAQGRLGLRHLLGTEEFVQALADHGRDGHRQQVHGAALDREHPQILVEHDDENIRKDVYQRLVTRFRTQRGCCAQHAGVGEHGIYGHLAGWPGIRSRRVWIGIWGPDLKRVWTSS